MTKSLFIVAPIAEAEIINAALEAMGHGPRNLSVPMLGDQVVDPDENGSLGDYTHLGCHWWATDDNITAVQAIRLDVAKQTIIRVESQSSNAAEKLVETVGEFITFEHKEFDDRKWGWKATIKAADPEFKPGDRWIAIYNDSGHRKFTYATAEFRLGDGAWTVESNEDKADKADVHWAVMFSARREVMGSLLVTRPSAITYLKFGLTPEV